MVRPPIDQGRARMADWSMLRHQKQDGHDRAWLTVINHGRAWSTMAWYYFAGSSHSIYINWKQNFCVKNWEVSVVDRDQRWSVVRLVNQRRMLQPTSFDCDQPWLTVIDCGRPWSNVVNCDRPWSIVISRTWSIDRRSAAGVAYYVQFYLILGSTPSSLSVSPCVSVLSVWWVSLHGYPLPSPSITLCVCSQYLMGVLTVDTPSLLPASPCVSVLSVWWVSLQWIPPPFSQYHLVCLHSLLGGCLTTVLPLPSMHLILLYFG